MTYKTHLAAGIASVLYLTAPSSLTELILCTGTAAVGSVISDVDASVSESRKNLGKVTAITVCAVTAVLAADHFAGTDIVSRFRSSASLMRLFTGLVLFLLVCIFGEHKPHRTFMHSLAGTAAVSFSFAVIIPSAFRYIAVSMLSHIALDTLNKKKIQLFYPLPEPKIGFNICYADGKVNELIFWGASAAAVIKLVTTVNSFR